MTNKVKSTIDLNTVDENSLIKKLNISARLAKRILAQRPYQSVDELKKVWGIDPQTLERILPLVSVKPKTLPTPATIEPPARSDLTPTVTIPDQSTTTEEKATQHANPSRPG